MSENRHIIGCINNASLSLNSLFFLLHISITPNASSFLSPTVIGIHNIFLIAFVLILLLIEIALDLSA